MQVCGLGRSCGKEQAKQKKANGDLKKLKETRGGNLQREKKKQK